MVAVVVEQTSWLIGSVAVRLGRIGRLRLPPRPDPAATLFDLETPDGARIASTYWPGARADSPAVLIVHGFTASQLDIRPNAVFFAQQGYAVLTIDLRGHGKSSDAPCGFGWTEAIDVHTAFTWLKRKQAGAKVAVIGISMGGAAVLLGPQGPVPADAFVLQAVFPDLRRAVRSRFAVVGGKRFADWIEPLLSDQAEPRLGTGADTIAPIAVVPSLTSPLLVIAGGKDMFTPLDETQALYAAATAPKALWVMPELGHNGVSNTIAGSYRARVFAFLRETIGDPALGRWQ